MPWCVSGRVDRTQYHLLCEGAQPLRLRLEQSCYHFSLFRLQVISESAWQLDGGAARAVAALPPLSVTSNWAEGKTDSEKRRATRSWLGNRHGCRTVVFVVISHFRVSNTLLEKFENKLSAKLQNGIFSDSCPWHTPTLSLTLSKEKALWSYLLFAHLWNFAI